MTAPRHRIWVDFNSRLPAPVDIYILHPTEIAPMADQLTEGMVVTITDDEIEMEATLRFDKATGFWLADPLQGTLRDLNGAV